MQKIYYMLDIKSKLVLKILVKECPNGAYSIVEGKDIISAMPTRYRVEQDGLDNILIYLERQEYISIKYDDDGVYCLCVLPFGNEVLESDDNKKRENAMRPRLFPIFALMFFASLLSSAIVLIIAYFLFIR
jgi:hypothetical protein